MRCDASVPCNCCGQPLVLGPQRHRATCACGQTIVFRQDGSCSQTVLPRLYPHKMSDPRMLREFAQYEVAQRGFFDTLRLRFGLISAAELVFPKQAN